MKLFLIEPNIEGRVGFPSLSLASIKSFINERTEHHAKIIDLTFHRNSWKAYLSKVMRNNVPELIGISLMSFNYAQSIEIASFLKDTFPHVKIILGGVHAILKPEQTISNDAVDMICAGEGEYSLKNLMDNHLNCKGVKGIWYKVNGHIIKNPDQQLIENLDELPFPDWTDFDLDKYFLFTNRHLPIMGSRGCPYACTFCSNHALKKRLKGTYVRSRSVDNVIEEITARILNMPDTGFEYFIFYDDTFILHRDFVMEFCRKYRRLGYHRKYKWTANVRANLVTDEIIKTMKSAGCYEAAMGIEASNNFIRNDTYKRNMTDTQIENAVNIIKANDLQLRAQFILGAPFETPQMMKETLHMAKKIDADVTMFPILMPLPGTKIRKICEDEGLIEIDSFHNSNDMFIHPIAKTKYATRKQIKRIVKKARNFQMRKYFFSGLRMKGVIFLWDLLCFLVYYKPKFKLEVDHAWKFIINEYNLERIRKNSA